VLQKLIKIVDSTNFGWFIDILRCLGRKPPIR